jgi:hypothetical protein
MFIITNIVPYNSKLSTVIQMRLSVECDAADVLDNWMHCLVNYSNGANNIPSITLMLVFFHKFLYGIDE